MFHSNEFVKLVLSKTNLVDIVSEYTKLMRAEFQFLSYVPIVFLSAKTKKRIQRLLQDVFKICKKKVMNQAFQV
jgi:predicted GTPase